MDRALYVAMSGANQAMLAQAINGHNLANLSTPGFRADLTAMLSVDVEGPGLPSRVNSISGGAGTDLSHGPLMYTENELDFAVNGNGWIAIQSLDGGEAYTRAGNLRIDALGQLTTGNGLPVLGEGGPIALPPFEKVEIGKDGTVSVRGLGQPSNALQIVDRIKLVNPDETQLEKGDDGLLRLGNGDIAPADASVSLITGALEGSNVNAVDALVNSIILARQFEAHIKVMETVEQNDSATTRLMQFS